MHAPVGLPCLLACADAGRRHGHPWLWGWRRWWYWRWLHEQPVTHQPHDWCAGRAAAAHARPPTHAACTAARLTPPQQSGSRMRTEGDRVEIPYLQRADGAGWPELPLPSPSSTKSTESFVLACAALCCPVWSSSCRRPALSTAAVHAAACELVQDKHDWRHHECPIQHQQPLRYTQLLRVSGRVCSHHPCCCVGLPDMYSLGWPVLPACAADLPSQSNVSPGLQGQISSAWWRDRTPNMHVSTQLGPAERLTPGSSRPSCHFVLTLCGLHRGRCGFGAWCCSWQQAADAVLPLPAEVDLCAHARAGRGYVC